MLSVRTFQTYRLQAVKAATQQENAIDVTLLKIRPTPMRSALPYLPPNTLTGTHELMQETNDMYSAASSLSEMTTIASAHAFRTSKNFKKTLTRKIE